MSFTVFNTYNSSLRIPVRVGLNVRLSLAEGLIEIIHLNPVADH